MELKSQIPFKIRDPRSSESENNSFKTRKSVEKINRNELGWLHDRILCLSSKLRTI